MPNHNLTKNPDQIDLIDYIAVQARGSDVEPVRVSRPAAPLILAVEMVLDFLSLAGVLRIYHFPTVEALMAGPMRSPGRPTLFVTKQGIVGVSEAAAIKHASTMRTGRPAPAASHDIARARWMSAQSDRLAA